MRATPKLLALALVGSAIGYFAQQAFAGPQTIVPRGNFSYVTGVISSQVGDCSSFGVLPLASGVDAMGPFFCFDQDSLGTRYTYTYRPRNADCGPCNVGHFGDGGIDAVQDFREMFERFKRSNNPFVPPGTPLCAPVVSIGGGTSCLGPCQVPLSITPRDVMTGPYGAGTAGAVLIIAAHPTTFTFEDHRFEYSVFN